MRNALADGLVDDHLGEALHLLALNHLQQYISIFTFLYLFNYLSIYLPLLLSIYLLIFLFKYLFALNQLQQYIYSPIYL